MRPAVTVRSAHQPRPTGRYSYRSTTCFRRSIASVHPGAGQEAERVPQQGPWNAPRDGRGRVHADGGGTRLDVHPCGCCVVPGACRQRCAGRSRRRARDHRARCHRHRLRAAARDGAEGGHVRGEARQQGRDRTRRHLCRWDAGRRGGGRDQNRPGHRAGFRPDLQVQHPGPCRSRHDRRDHGRGRGRLPQPGRPRRPGAVERRRGRPERRAVHAVRRHGTGAPRRRRPTTSTS